MAEQNEQNQEQPQNETEAIQAIQEELMKSSGNLAIVYGFLESDWADYNDPNAMLSVRDTLFDVMNGIKRALQFTYPFA